MSFAGWMLNKMFTLGDRKRDEGLTTPQDVERRDNINYGPNKEWNLLDVYYPKKREGKLPVIVSIHGGGWVYGNKEVYQFYCMNLAQRGFAVVNFTYRLAPMFKFPAPLEDTNNVIQWILDHAEEYEFDTNYIYLVGDSAGAHMSSLYTCICTNSEYATQYPFKVPKGFVPNAVALNCGVYNVPVSVQENKMNFKQLMIDFLGKNDFENKLLKISPQDYITKNFPPTYLMTSVADFLVKQAPFMEVRLKELGIPYEYKIYGDENNKLMHVFHCNIKDKNATECNDAECAFFRKY